MGLTAAHHLTEKESWELRFAENRELLEHMWRSTARAEYLGGTSALCRVLDRFLMLVRTTDMSVAPHLIMGGCWEAWVTLAIARHLKPGMTCIDVGANLGYYTLLMASFCGAENVIAVEPLYQSMLKITLRLNGYEDVQVHDCALSDEGDERRTFYVPTNYQSSATLYPRLIGDKDTHSACNVRVMTLDRLLFDNPVVINGEAEGLRAIDFIKIDAEGSEPDIWKGMRGTWASNPDMVCCLEFDRDFYPNAPGVLTEFCETANIRYITTRGELSPADAEPSAVANEILGFKGSTMLWLTHKDD